MRCFARLCVQQLDPDDDTSMYHIFERLNTGGTLLTNQEIRNCIFHGSFAEYIATLNKESTWRGILGKPNADSRKKDIELMVRFFAMRDISAYQKPMKDFLSKFMYKNKDASDRVLAASAEVFRKTCGALTETLGEKPFHIRSGLNVAVADAVMVAFSQHIDRVPSDIGSRYEELKADEIFEKATRESTTDVDIVRERFKRAKEVLFG